jgi:hypothetical protein
MKCTPAKSSAAADSSDWILPEFLLPDSIAEIERGRVDLLPPLDTSLEGRRARLFGRAPDPVEELLRTKRRRERREIQSRFFHEDQVP